MSSITGAGGGSAVGAVKFIQGNSGGAVGPDNTGVINVLGAGNITVAGNAGTFTETISLTGITQYSVQVGGAGNTLTQLANGTTGQVLTAQTGANPIWAAPAGGITTINGDSGSVTGATVSILGGATNAGPTVRFVASGTTLQLQTSSGNNTLIGAGSGTNLSGVANTTLGQSSSNFSGASSYNTNFNTVVGFQAFRTTPTAVLNFISVNQNIFGYNSGGLIGNAGVNTVVFQDNCVFGKNSLNQTVSNSTTTVSEQNCFFGNNIMAAATNYSSQNSAFGHNALTAFVGTGSNDGNTCFGNSTLVQLVNGINNIAIGISAGSNYTGTESYNIVIGSLGVAGDNNYTRIGYQTGGATQTKCWIDGIRGVTTDVNDAIPVLIDSAGQLGTTSSSERYKENIKPFDSSAILQANPVQFNFKGRPENQVQYGLIAEELAQLVPDMVVYKDNQPETIKYQHLPIFLLAEIKKLVARVDELEAKLKGS